MTAKEYADLNQRSLARVYQLLKQGRIPHQVINDHVVIDEQTPWPTLYARGKKFKCTQKEAV